MKNYLVWFLLAGATVSITTIQAVAQKGWVCTLCGCTIIDGDLAQVYAGHPFCTACIKKMRGKETEGKRVTFADPIFAPGKGDDEVKRPAAAVSYRERIREKLRQKSQDEARLRLEEENRKFDERQRALDETRKMVDDAKAGKEPLLKHIDTGNVEYDIYQNAVLIHNPKARDASIAFSVPYEKIICNPDGKKIELIVMEEKDARLLDFTNSLNVESQWTYDPRTLRFSTKRAAEAYARTQWGFKIKPSLVNPEKNDFLDIDLTPFTFEMPSLPASTSIPASPKTSA